MPRPPFALLLLIAACSGPAGSDAKAPAAAPDEAPRKAATPVATAAASATASARGGASAVEESTPLYQFDYSYPAEAGRIAGLRAMLDGERSRLRRELIAEATEGRNDAREGGFDYRPYASGVAWQKVTETPRFLSLSAQVYSDSGGAHPNHGFDSLMWDRQANARLQPLDLFTGAAAFDRAVGERFCAALDKQRAERRDEPVRRDSGDQFDECIAASKQTVILGSSSGRTFDRVGVLVGPYAAGPYAEGDYEVTLPVDAALVAAVKPEYRAFFAAR